MIVTRAVVSASERTTVHASVSCGHGGIGILAQRPKSGEGVRGRAGRLEKPLAPPGPVAIAFVAPVQHRLCVLLLDGQQQRKVHAFRLVHMRAPHALGQPRRVRSQGKARQGPAAIPIAIES